MVASLALATAIVLPHAVGTQPASAAVDYTPWACGSVRHGHGGASAFVSLTSSVLGCGAKVALRCWTGEKLTGVMLGPLAFTGQTSSRNCPVGYIYFSHGWQMGTGW